ncbi:MAG TPA: TonB-dependent receptor [Caulobacteraceae bacterium]
MAAVATSAHAAPRRTFAVRTEPLTTALFDFAVQANVSISLDAALGCRGVSNPLSGSYTVAEGLGRLLAGTGCGYRMVDVGAVRIVRLPPQPPSPSVRSSPAISVSPSTTLAAPPIDLPISEVVVTATRRNALADSLPVAMSTISSTDLAGTRAGSIGDLSAQATGLTVTNLGPGRDKFIIRGLSDGPLTGHTQAAVGLYVDDIRLAYNAPDPDLKLVDVDRVEILRGPQGSLYGAGSISGLLRVVTRQPDMEHFSALVTASGSGATGGAPSEDIEAVANFPLVEGRLAARAVIYREHQGGYLDDFLIGRRNTNFTDRTGGRLALRYRLSDDWTLSAGFIRQGLYSGDAQYATGGVNGLQRAVLLMEPNDNEFTQGYATVEGETPLGRFKNAFAVIRHEIDARYDATTVLPQFAPGLPLRPSPYDDHSNTHLLVDEVSLVSPGAGRFQWLAGGFLSVGRQTLQAALTTPGPPGASDRTVYDEDRTDDILELALFGEGSYRLTSRLTFTLGARVYGTRISTFATTQLPLSHTADVFQGRLTDSGLAPKIALQYQLGGHAMSYVQAAEGYRAGGFNTSGPVGQTFATAPGAPQPYRRFTGDNLWIFETGVKAHFFRDRINVRAASFYTLWKNIQSDLPLHSGLPFTANIGDGRNVGLEAEASYAVDGLRLRGNVMFDRPELVRLNPGFPTIQHSGLPGVPRLSVGADLRYVYAVSHGATAVFNAQYAYVGVSRLTFDASTAPSQGGFSTGKVSLGLNAGRWSATAFLDNPANAVGNTFAYGNPFTLRHALQVTPQRPRTAGVEVSRSF